MLLIVSSLFFATASFGFQQTAISSNFTFKIIPSRVEASVALYLSNLNGQRVELSIKDANGEFIHKKRINNENAFAKLYNLSDLTNGNYSFGIETEDRILSNPFVIIDKKIVLVSEEDKERLKPVVDLEDRLLKVSVDLNSEVSDLEIIMMDDYDNVIYENSMSYLNNMTKRYDLTALENGTYTVKVIIEDDPYYKKIVLE